MRSTCTLWKDLVRSCVNLAVIVHCGLDACVHIGCTDLAYCMQTAGSLPLSQMHSVFEEIVDPIYVSQVPAISGCVPVTYDSSNYSYCTDLSSRPRAELACILQGTKLLVLETTAEFNFWADRLEKIRSSMVWVGAMWNSTYRGFVWDKTKNRIPPIFFIRETTPPHTADCVHFQKTSALLGLLSGSFKLDIDDCSTRKSYICEENPPATTTEAETTTAAAAATTSAETTTAEVATTETTTTEVATTETTTAEVATTETTTTEVATTATTTEVATTETTTTLEVTTEAETITLLSFTIKLETTAIATSPDFTTIDTATSTTEEASTESTTSALQTATNTPITTEVTTDSTSFTTTITTEEPETTKQLDTLSTSLTDPTSSIPSSLLVFNTTVLCVCVNRVNIPRGEEEKEAFVEEQKKKIHTELDVNKETLSSTVRKKISYEDNRPSVAFVGYAGIAFICVIMGSILLLDVTRCAAVVEKFKTCSCSNTKTRVTEKVP